MRIHGSYDPIVFQTERGRKIWNINPPTRIDEIIRLIQEEAKERKGFKDYAGKLYDVKLDVDLRVGMLVKSIQDRERDEERRKEVEKCQTT